MSKYSIKAALLQVHSIIGLAISLVEGIVAHRSRRSGDWSRANEARSRASLVGSVDRSKPLHDNLYRQG
jgi:hypothetical protein